MVERESGCGAGTGEQLSSSSPSLLCRLDQTHVPMLLARVALGGVFITQSLAKIAEPIHFLKVIREFQLLPENPPFFINMTAIGMPWVELICGILLVIGFRMRGAALLVLLMMVTFTTAVFLRALGEFNTLGIPFCDIEFDCGCGGGKPINICRKLLINSGLTIAALVATFSSSRFLTIESLFKKKS